ncbi:MAG: DNA repair protein RecN, partial [candidate division KSB1 bacterium]|nr:DNA repair protein RecN [candidate division KSB1 bacterium]
IPAKERAIKQQKGEDAQHGQALSQRRHEAGHRLEQEVLSRLAELGMKNARFSVQIRWIPDEKGIITIDQTCYRVSDRGLDHVEFYIATNPGEDLKPLVKVASGGEISRIMLALKSSLAQVDRIPVLIFDEIDMGISGRIAQAVGLALKRLSKTHQIICITHLPQIASMGDHHFVVEKIVESNSTRTTIRKLTREDRAIEIAKLLGGQSVTETHIQAARELIEEANQFESHIAHPNYQN